MVGLFAQFREGGVARYIESDDFGKVAGGAKCPEPPGCLVNFTAEKNVSKKLDVRGLLVGYGGGTRASASRLAGEESGFKRTCSRKYYVCYNIRSSRFARTPYRRPLSTYR